jgi:hypothetical protein
MCIFVFVLVTVTNLISQMLSNFASILRKTGHYFDAIFWYKKCLTLSPTDFYSHIDIAYTLHLMRR